MTAPGLEDALARSLGSETLSPIDLRLALRRRPVVLVIDGADRCAADIVPALQALEICPTLRVVVTSVRRLKGRMTKEVMLQGLECPPTEWIPSRDPTRYEAVELFTAVALSISPSLDFGDDFQTEIAPLCRALDGLPLAIVLAAARVVRSNGVHAGLSHLLQSDSSFGLALGAELRDPGHKRGGSVHDALDRTYLSLDVLEQGVWECTSVFEGPFDLQAAEQVSGMTRYALVGPLEELVSLRVVDPGPAGAGEPRYALSSLSRAFARSKLERRSETRVVADRHASYVCELVCRSSRRYDDCDPRIEDSIVRSEGDLYAALDHLVASGSRSQALELAGDMGHVALATGHLPELLTRLDQLIGDPPIDGDTRSLAHALLWAAHLGTQSVVGPDTLTLTRTRWSTGMTLARASSDDLLVLRGLAGGVLALPVTRDFGGSAGAAEEGRELAEQIGHARWLARFTAWSGMVAHMKGDYESAARFATDALGSALRSGDRSAVVLVGLLVSGMPPEHAPSLSALPSLEDLLSVAVELGDRSSQSSLLVHLAARAFQRADYGSSATWILRQMKLVRGSRSWNVLGHSLMCAVGVVWRLGDPRLAARVHGALVPMLDLLRASQGGRDRASYAGIVQGVRSELGMDVFDREVRSGSQLSYVDALEAAVPLLSEHARRPDHEHVLTTPHPEATGLTAREGEVLRCLADGLSNKEIAARLGISQKTVTNHTTAIYRKLGVRNRAEAAVAAVRLERACFLTR